MNHYVFELASSLVYMSNWRTGARFRHYVHINRVTDPVIPKGFLSSLSGD